MNKLFVIFCFMASVHATKPTAVKLTDIQVLTLKKNYLTTTAKSLSLTQLECSGYNCKHAPDVVQCTNSGIDDRGEVNWSCEGDLPTGLSFKNACISCEGFPKGSGNVLVGSCRFKYSLSSAHRGHNTPASIGAIMIITFVIIVGACNCPGALLGGIALGAALGGGGRRRRGRRGIWGGSSGGTSDRRTAKAFVSKTHIR